MVLLRDLGELLEADAVVLVGVLHAGLAEHRGHRAGTEPAVDRHDAAVAAFGLELVRAAARRVAGEEAHLAHLLGADGETEVGVAGLRSRRSAVRTAVAPVAHTFTTL